MPELTVLLPVFNAGGQLSTAVASILNQDYQDWRLLIIDDGSTDGAIHDVEKLKDTRIEIIHGKTNLGLSHRLNQGIDVAETKYIARMDADDISFRRRFSAQIEYLEQNPSVDLVGCNSITFNDQFDVGCLLKQKFHHDEITETPWRGIPIAHPTWMGRTAWFKKHKYRIPEFKRAEDQELLLRSYKESYFANLENVHFAYNFKPPKLKAGLIERLSVFKFQTEHFVFNREFKNLLLGHFFSSLKLCLYLAHSLSVTRPNYPARSGNEPQGDAVEEFYKTLDEVKALLARNGL